MNKFTKWIVNKLGGVDPADVKPREITLIKTGYEHELVSITILTPKDDMKLSNYSEWEKDRAAYGIGRQIIENGLFNRTEMYYTLSDTMVIKYTARVLKKGCNNEEIDG